MVDPDVTAKHGPYDSTLYALNILFNTCGREKEAEMITKLLPLKLDSKLGSVDFTNRGA